MNDYVVFTLLTFIVGVEAVAILSKRVREVNIQRQLKVDKEAWPPEPPKTFTPLVLIQHHGHRNLKQSIAMAEFVERGHIDKAVTTTDVLPKHPKHLSRQPLQEVLDTSKVTKEVAEILAPLETSDDPQFILIEGAPGIGKSLLLKHIAYRWSIQQILQKFKLVLLICLRDPAVQQMSFTDDLLQSFCKRDRRATETASACSDYLSENNGEDLALLFDGYDEYPERLRKDSLIADILEREVLPRCGLIVSSRPHASVSLRQEATVRVDILGFTEAEREHYIKESMKGQPQKIDELTQYLQGHSTISSLCFVPFNLVTLVYLYKQGYCLPKNHAELYNYFICLTICRHLAKHGHHLQGNITKLTNLPVPYNKIIQQLSKLSLEALNDDKLIFTFEEIKASCPDMTAIPGAINGFGLLQAVEHFGFTGMTTTINFLHFSIQEYLAAHHIANLPADEELKIIKEKFWSDIHFNMFSIYVSLTKGQRPSFKHFLCGGNKAIAISDKFLSNPLQCLHLYRCFHEAGDVDICKTIERSVTFSDKEINHTIGENEQLYSILSNPSTMLEELYMEDTKLSSRAAIALFTALNDNNKLKWLIIDNNAITDDACAAITTALERNSCLVRLYMHDNPLTGEAIVNIVNCLKVNNTLELLWLPLCPEDIKKTIGSLQEVINKNRESRGCQVKLRIDYW